MKRAFTMIEILVTMGLFLIITGVVIGNFRGVTSQQKVNQSVALIRQTLQTARANAMAGKKMCTGTLVSWAVVVYQNGDDNFVKLTNVCAAGDQIDTGNWQLSEGVTITNNIVHFNPLSGGLVGQADVNFTVTHNDVTGSVLVKSSGEII